MQLAKYYKKSHYDFLLPYMSGIVDYTMARVNSEPTLLVELCRFISMGVPEFIRRTLPETLPKLIIRRDRSGLGYIENTLGEHISALILGPAAELLACIFLLRDANSIDEALAFTLDLLNENTGQQRVTLESLILSCEVALLTELVIAMHNKDPDIQSLVRFPFVCLRPSYLRYSGDRWVQKSPSSNLSVSFQESSRSQPGCCYKGVRDSNHARDHGAPWRISPRYIWQEIRRG